MTRMGMLTDEAWRLRVRVPDWRERIRDDGKNDDWFWVTSDPRGNQEITRQVEVARPLLARELGGHLAGLIDAQFKRQGRGRVVEYQVVLLNWTAYRYVDKTTWKVYDAGQLPVST